MPVLQSWPCISRTLRLMSSQIQLYTTGIQPAPVWTTNAVDTSSSALCCHFGWAQRATEPTSVPEKGTAPVLVSPHHLTWANNVAGDISQPPAVTGIRVWVQRATKAAASGSLGIQKARDGDYYRLLVTPDFCFCPQEAASNSSDWCLGRIPPGVLVQNSWVIGSCGRGACWGCRVNVLLVAALLLTLALPRLREALTSAAVFGSSSPVRLGPTDPPFPVSGLQLCAGVDV